MGSIQRPCARVVVLEPLCSAREQHGALVGEWKGFLSRVVRQQYRMPMSLLLCVQLACPARLRAM